MNWININVNTLDSEEFLGASPSERATWLCLLRYCCGQENGGTIVEARDWKDRKWQQIVRVTQKEVLSECDLWAWDGDSLVVWAYPVDKEQEVIKKRVAGKSGGRPKTNQKDNHEGNHMVTDSETITPQSAETERNRKGKEGNIQLQQQQARGAPASLEEALAYAKQFMSPNTSGLNATEDIVQAWHDARASIGWVAVRGQTEIPIADWQADLKGFIRKWNQHERTAPQTAATASNVVKMPQAQQKPPTVWELGKRIEAAEAQIGKIRGINLTKNLPAAKQDEIHKLRDSIATWRKQITEQGG